MNEEIKEMLELHIKHEIDLLPKNQKTVLDYITNLQQEKDYYFKKNNELSTLNTSLRSDRDNYKIRIEKANEFINENTELEHDGDDYGYMEWIDIINMDTMTFINNLSDILNGRSDE